MFTFDPDHKFSRDVEISVPSDQGFTAQTLKVRYRRVGLDAIKGFDIGSAEGQLDYCNAIVDAFLDVVDEKNQVIPHSAALKQQLLDPAYPRLPVMRAYDQAMVGAQLKN